MLGNKLPNIQFAKYHIWNNKSEGFPNMVLSTETFNQSLRTEYSEAVNARYTFQPLWVSDTMDKHITIWIWWDYEITYSFGYKNGVVINRGNAFCIRVAVFL